MLGHSSEKLNWVIGGYYFNEQQSVVTSASAGLIVGGNTTRYALSTKAYAAFGQATLSVLPGLRVIGGVRYSVDDKTIDGQGLTQYPSPLFFAGAPCNGQPEFCLRDNFFGARSFKRTSWKGGLEYDLAPANLLYATASTGHKMGGFNPFSIAGTVNTASSYNPEQVLAFEAGSRNRFLDNRLQLNIEGFYWKYSDAQQFITTLNRIGAPANALTNAGQASLYGVDVDLTARPAPSDTFHVAVEYLHSNFDSFVYSAGGAVAGLTTGCQVSPGVPFPLVNCNGNPLPRAPRYSGTASYTHSFELPNGGKLEATAATQYSGSRFLTIDYTAASKASGYITGDFTLAYVAPVGWQIAAFVRNVGDAINYTGGFTQAVLPSLTLANVAPPRTFGASFTGHF